MRRFWTNDLWRSTRHRVVVRPPRHPPHSAPVFATSSAPRVTARPGGGAQSATGTTGAIGADDATGGLEGGWRKLEAAAYESSSQKRVDDESGWQRLAAAAAGAVHPRPSPADHADGANGANADVDDRMSLIFFHMPNYDAVIDCAEVGGGTVGPERPRRYPPFRSGDRSHFTQLLRTERGLPDRQTLRGDNTRGE